MKTSNDDHSAPSARFQAGRSESIRTTSLPDEHVTILTVKLDDPNLLRRFATFTFDDVIGKALPAATESAALQAHDALVRGSR